MHKVIFDEKPELFISGYFAERALAGDKTVPDEPKGKLPKVPPGAEMEIKTCFMAAKP